MLLFIALNLRTPFLCDLSLTWALFYQDPLPLQPIDFPGLGEIKAPSGYIVQYGNNEIVLLGGFFSPTGAFKFQGSFGTSATHLLGSCSKKKRGKKGGKMTTIQASLNKSGASYPGSSGGLIGVVLALNVLIVSFLSTVM